MKPAILPAPDMKRMHACLQALCVPRDVLQDTVNLRNVEDYIVSNMERWGYTVSRRPFAFEGLTLNNLCIRRNPRVPARLLVGAHFDAVPGTPGADDNASGIAALMEAARILANHPASEHIEFAAFNAEEYGMVGSRRYAAEMKAQKVRLEGMLSLEMLGYTSSQPGSQKVPALLAPFYPDTGNFLALVGNIRSAALLYRARKSFRKGGAPLRVHTLVLPGKGWIFPACRLSDHSPFWDAGYPALMVTDTSFFRNPFYHLPSDSIETLDLGFLARSTAGLIELCRTLAG